MKELKTKLSYVLYTLLVVFIFCGCENTGTSKANTNYETIVIEKCEYVIYSTFSGNVGYGYMAHKGNCKECSKK
jgi:putative salt-induced outer membrane protein YdiY